LFRTEKERVVWTVPDQFVSGRDERGERKRKRKRETKKDLSQVRKCEPNPMLFLKRERERAKRERERKESFSRAINPSGQETKFRLKNEAVGSEELKLRRSRKNERETKGM